MRTLKLKFLTDANESFAVSINYADPELARETRKTAALAAQNALIAAQPFDVVLASANGAEIIDRTVTDLI